MRANTIKLKRDFIIEQLKEKGVTHSQTGKKIHALSYDELKYELVLASFRQIDVEGESAKWF